MGIGKSIENLILGGTNTTTYTAPPAPTMYTVRGHTLSDADLQTLRNTLFAEISNRNLNKQQLEARTIANTALNRMDQYKANGKPMSLTDVLTQPKQYQGYNSPEYQRIVSGKTKPTDTQKLSAIDSVLGNIKAGKLDDNSEGMVYYHHDPTGVIHLTPGQLFAQPKKVPTALSLAPKAQ